MFGAENFVVIKAHADRLYDGSDHENRKEDNEGCQKHISSQCFAGAQSHMKQTSTLPGDCRCRPYCLCTCHNGIPSQWSKYYDPQRRGKFITCPCVLKHDASRAKCYEPMLS